MGFLSEIRSPGQYHMKTGKCSILEAEGVPDPGTQLVTFVFQAKVQTETDFAVVKSHNLIRDK